MIKKIIFVIVFAAVHYFLTLILLQRYLFNYNPNVDTGLWSQFCRVLAVVSTLPVVLPMMMLRLLDEYQPMWAQILPFIVNSLVWAVVILALFAGIKRLRRKKEELQAPSHTQAGPAVGGGRWGDEPPNSYFCGHFAEEPLRSNLLKA